MHVLVEFVPSKEIQWSESADIAPKRCVCLILQHSDDSKR